MTKTKSGIDHNLADGTSGGDAKEAFHLVASGVRKVYGGGRTSLARPGVTALAGVDVDVVPGIRLGIVGESGSGKSTLGRLLAGLEQPSEGTVAYNGRELQDFGRRERREFRGSVQMVFQDPFTAFNPRRTIFASFRDVMRSWGAKDDEAIRARAESVGHQVGLDPEHLDRFPHQLSGGQRQRLAIARCLIVDPDVLIADEVVSALDVSVQAQVLNLFRALVSELRLGLVFISHDLRAVAFIADRTVVMYGGRIVEEAPTAEILSAPRHPYTLALLDAAYGDEAPIPAEFAERAVTPEALGNEGETVERGQDAATSSCVYAARCALRPLTADPERCVTDFPALGASTAGRAVACHFPLSTPRENSS